MTKLLTFRYRECSDWFVNHTYECTCEILIFSTYTYIAVPLVMVAQFHTDVQVQILNIIYKASEKINLCHKKNQITQIGFVQIKN